MAVNADRPPKRMTIWCISKHIAHVEKSQNVKSLKICNLRILSTAA